MSAGKFKKMITPWFCCEFDEITERLLNELPELPNGATMPGQRTEFTVLSSFYLYDTPVTRPRRQMWLSEGAGMFEVVQRKREKQAGKDGSRDRLTDGKRDTTDS